MQPPPVEKHASSERHSYQRDYPTAIIERRSPYHIQILRIVASVLAFGCMISLYRWNIMRPFGLEHRFRGVHVGGEGMCPQPQPLLPESNMGLLSTLEETYAKQDFKSWAIESLSGAIRIPYVVLSCCW